MTDLLLGGKRAAELLWRDLRLVVLDLETLWDTSDLPADADVAAAIASVQTTDLPVLLSPQPRAVRRLQHRAIEDAGLSSASTGTEPDRAVEVQPGARNAPARVVGPGRHRAISIAIVSCERGHIAGATWQSLINPGVPVDPETYKIHRLTTDTIRQAPSFAVIAPEVLKHLLPVADETVVLVTHNASFDIGVLRTEFEEIGHALPDLPILDTGGSLARHVGVSPLDGSLKELLAALRLTNTAPHTAAGDALATAEAALALLRLAADRGESDIGALLGGQRVSTTRSSAGKPISRPTLVVHPARHVGLPDHPTPAQVAAWTDLADECAQHRCPDLGHTFASLARTANAAPTVVLGALGEALRRRAAANDGPGANTVLGAVIAAFARWCPMPAQGFTGNYPIRRKETIAFYHQATALAATLPACGRDACPACCEGAPCPRFELARGLASGALDPKWKDGRLTKESTMLAWLRADEHGGWFYHRGDPATTVVSNRAGTPAGPVLADAVTTILLRGYRTVGEEPDRVARVRDQLARVVAAGCTDPLVAEMWVWRLATAGRPADLEAAIAACDAALGNRPAGAVEAAWPALEVVRAQLAGRLGRIKTRERITPEGTVEVVRIHHPGAMARRIRPLRFVRA